MLTEKTNEKKDEQELKQQQAETEEIIEQPAEEKPRFKFDKSFQEKILQAMIMDRHWAVQFHEVLDVDYFEYAHLKLIANRYVNHYRTYKEFPSTELLLGMTKEELKHGKDAMLKEQCRRFFIRVESKKDLGDLKYVKEKALDFCKRASLQKALEQCVDHIASEKYEKVVDVVKKAINAGNEQSPGLDLTKDVDARYSETYRRVIPTGIMELDQRKILNGGLGAGEIGFVVAPTGGGKSHILTQFGASALQCKKNVVHYTFELNERIIGIRYDSNLTDTNSLDCLENQEAIKQYYADNKEKLGRLIVKYFPTGQASCQTLRSHLEKLANQNFVPDLVIVDYAGIMRSADRNDMLRLELKKVCEELRALGQELDVPLWTAIQSNKEGSNSEVVDLTNLAESYGQAHVADFVLGLSRQSAQKASGFGNIFVAKNRAGMDGIKYLIHLDTGKSKLRILTDHEAAEFREESLGDSVEVMRQKFKEIQERKQAQ